MGQGTETIQARHAQRQPAWVNRWLSGEALLAWVFLIFMSGSADRVDVFLGLDYATQIWIYRVGIWVVPVVVFFVTRRVCRELAEGQRIR